MTITANVLGEAVQLTGNPTWIECTGASLPVGASDYKVMLKVISTDFKLDGSPFIDAKFPDFSGTAYFNIQGYVDKSVDALFQYPISGTKIQYPTQAFNITVTPGERYIDTSGTLVENWYPASVNFQMLKGGLSPRQIAMMNADSTNFYDTYIAGDKWLTPRPQGDQVHPDQDVKLWYMVAANSTPDFVVKTYFSDSSTSTVTISSPLNVDYLYEFNCNPKHHSVNLEPAGAKAVYFEIYLDFGGDVFSDKRQFYFDWRYCERPYFLFFANGLGGVDDVFFRGDAKDLFITEKTISTRPPQRSDTIFNPTEIVSSVTGQNKWTINTGWKFLTTLQFYRDLLISKQAWYLYANKTQTTQIIIPVTIDPGEQIIYDRKENIFNMEITLTEAHKTPFSFDNRMY